jgi:release factor glutamine methyltransferase
MGRRVYPPSEDTFVLMDILKKERIQGKVLELGTGSGIVGKMLHNMGASVTVTDINPSSVEMAKSMGLKAVESDLFERVKGKFDVLVFNPPYLPEDVKTEKWLDKATIGGKKGIETIERFLVQARKHLNKDGRIYLVFSSRTGDVLSMARKKGYKPTVLGSKSFFFERIFVAKLTL